MGTGTTSTTHTSRPYWDNKHDKHIASLLGQQARLTHRALTGITSTTHTSRPYWDNKHDTHIAPLLGQLYIFSFAPFQNVVIFRIPSHRFKLTAFCHVTEN